MRSLTDTLIRIGAAILGGGMLGYAAFIFTGNAMAAALVAVVAFVVVAYFVKQ